MSLDELVEAVASQLETAYGAVAAPDPNFPVQSIDGTDVVAYTTNDYQQAGFTISAVLVVAEHDGSAYAFVANTLAEETSSPRRS